MRFVKFSMRKMLLVAVVLFPICAFGYFYSENMIQPSTDTFVSKKTSEQEVVFFKKWDKNVGAYFLHFTNCRTDKKFYITFEYYSEDSGKYIKNADYLGKAGRVKMCCGERGLYRNLKIVEYE